METPRALALGAALAVSLAAACCACSSGSGSSASSSSASKRPGAAATQPPRPTVPKGPPVRSFGSAMPATAAAAPPPAAHAASGDAPGPQPTKTAAAGPAPTVVIVQEDIRLRSSAGRFSPLVSAPAGSKLPGYNRKPPAGGRRQAAPLVTQTVASVLERGEDKRGVPWLRVQTGEGVVGWLPESATAPQG